MIKRQDVPIKASLIIAVYAISVLMLCIIAFASLLFGVGIPAFTMDVTAIAKIHPFAGILSNLGIYLWCMSASVCLFSAWLISSADEKPSYWFLLSSGCLSLYLMADDAFMFHEFLAPTYLGLDEKFVYGGLVASLTFYLIYFRREIIDSHYAILFVACLFLGCSVAVDAILEPWLRSLGEWQFFIEDGCKWLGIVSWFLYHLINSHELVCSIRFNLKD